jgi:hypothetical protein
MRRVHQYGPELDKWIRRHLKKTNDSRRVDETYVKVKGEWMYLYRVVDSKGNTIDFYFLLRVPKKGIFFCHNQSYCSRENNLLESCLTRPGFNLFDDLPVDGDTFTV